MRMWLACPAAALAVAVTGVGCAHPRTETRLPGWAFEANDNGFRHDGRRPPPPRTHPRGGVAGRSEASDFVVSALQEAGFRFGTDGTVPALWGYLRTSHVVVSPSDTHRGDVLFFRLSTVGGAATQTGCGSPDHAGIVSEVDDDGRIVFVEARDGNIGKRYVDPRRPQLRRDLAGRIHNSFLREKRISDPPDSPNFAGEMLCAAARPRS